MTTETATNAQGNSRNMDSALASVALALSGCLWGTGFFFGKIALAEMTVSENVVYRFAFGSIGLAPILITQMRKFARKDFWLVVFAGVIAVPVQFLVQFKGLELTTVSHASLMVGTLPMMLGLSSVLVLREHLKWMEWGALLLAAFGALLIAISRSAGHGDGPQPSTLGDFLVCVSMMAAVVMILITKRLVRHYDPLYLTACMIGIGTIFLLLWVEGTQPIRFHFSQRAWIAVAAQGVLATTLAFLFWNWGIARVPASRAGVFLNLEPLIGALLGVLILHETLGSTAILGGAMILGAAAYFSKVHSQPAGDHTCAEKLPGNVENGL